MTDEEADKALARKGRTVALVIAGTMLIWIAVQWIAPEIRAAGSICAAVRLCRPRSPDLGDGQHISDEAGPRGQP